ncbi:MAG: alpha/beta hydrolase [Bauldia sp.]|nr:alpha/beta hydrolase [Bauldia sp.]
MSLDFEHRFQPAGDAARRPLLLLHGTGGNEDDLLPLGALLAPGAALLSPRGKVLERGMPRFFRRLGEGVFDEEDVRFRAGELADFVVAARREYGLAAPVAVGFSNGANIAAAVLQLRPDTLAAAVLLRPMVTLQEPPAADLRGKPVLVVSGAADPLVPVDNARRLAAQLAAAGAAVDHQIVPTGHALSETDVEIARSWIERLGEAASPN